MSELNLRPEDLDRLGQALITVTKELWVVKDRLRMLEATLAAANIMDSDAVDRFEPDSALAQELSAERGQLIQQLLAALAPDQKN